MLITKQWSEPKPIEYGKNVLIKSSHENFDYKIYTSTGKSVQGTIHSRTYIIDADHELIRLIRFPVISFRANTNDELHVDFEII